jgi:hypothetical protein
MLWKKKRDAAKSKFAEQLHDQIQGQGAFLRPLTGNDLLEDGSSGKRG